jgi:hypothetical protein
VAHPQTKTETVFLVPTRNARITFTFDPATEMDETFFPLFRQSVIPTPVGERFEAGNTFGKKSVSVVGATLSTHPQAERIVTFQMFAWNASRTLTLSKAA